MKYLLIILIICLVACNRGTWINGQVYRPKKPKFSVIKSSFKSNSLIDNNSLYMFKRPFLNYDGRELISFMGFYEDGQLIFDNTEQNQLVSMVKEKSSFETASTIGYYTTEEEKITVELFLPADGGIYRQINGIVKKDTIIFIENINMLFRKESRYDTLIKSSFSLMK